MAIKQKKAHSVAAEGKEPSREEIEKLAYQIYLQRGGGDGRTTSDWLQAEQILRAKNNMKQIR